MLLDRRSSDRDKDEADERCSNQSIANKNSIENLHAQDSWIRED